MQPEEIKKTPRPTAVPEVPATRASGRARTVIVVVLVVAALATGGVVYWNYAKT